MLRDLISFLGLCRYQLDLCRKAVEENIIVYLGTGCGKTHIAVLLMYELRALIKKPCNKVCVFLAPTIPLVRQQAMVIENSTDFIVRCHYGSRNLKDHQEWMREIEQCEVLVMTPQILLHNLQHCFIKMERISLLIFDECHHAQKSKRHPYAQIMKEFYKANDVSSPRIFGMTASPIMGKGGTDYLNYTKCINSLESLLNAKVCSVDEISEMESIVSSPETKWYLYGPANVESSSAYNQKFMDIKLQIMMTLREKVTNVSDCRKLTKLLQKLHNNLIFSLETLGVYGAIRAAKILLTSDGIEQTEMDSSDSFNWLPNQFLARTVPVLASSLSDHHGVDFSSLEAMKEPIFSAKLSVLIRILSNYSLVEDMKCIIFVKRIIVARTLACIIGSLKILEFWKCEYLVGCSSGKKNMSRTKMNDIVEKFSSGKVNLLVATNVAEEGLDIQTCCLVVRFDLPDTVASFIQSRGRARMMKSEYVFLVERENLHDEKLLNDFISGENIMNKEISRRTSDETFDGLEEITYKVDSTGATISTACSISLLHRYCNKLSHDKYFTPMPKFFYEDDINGTICKISLPPNAPIRLVDGVSCQSKDDAKRVACLKACEELHKLGALSDYLLPGLSGASSTSSALNSQSGNDEDEISKEELHETLVPDIFKGPWISNGGHVTLHFYYIKFNPVPNDRDYRMFGLFTRAPLPKEAESLQVELHLARSRIVKTELVPSGVMKVSDEEIVLAQNFQEMCLKVILDRLDFSPDFVSLERCHGHDNLSSKHYLLLPVSEQKYKGSMMIDWTTIRHCLSSPVFSGVINKIEKGGILHDTMELLSGRVKIDDVLNSLVFTPHNKLFFFVDAILPQVNASSGYKDSKVTTYAEYYMERFGIQLSHPEQPFLKAKPLFNLRNLLYNRVHNTTEARELLEHFVELPPELCQLKIVGFTKDIGSSLSLLPSFMHRLENILVAIELKDVLCLTFPEASEIRAQYVLEALTTEKCLERISLERFEVLGDAFLKYAVGRHSFLSYEGLDEGQLTRKRSNIVKNSNLYDLAIKRNLQVYIRDEIFDPAQFFALGRPCQVVCTDDVHQQPTDATRDRANVKCYKLHRWLYRKTIADVVESLVGAFLVGSGFKAAIAFLRWIGILVDFDVSSVHRACQLSMDNMSLLDMVNINEVETLLGHKFNYKGLLLQALVHPSFTKHTGGCYQKLEFLGDAVMEYLITSYLYSVYPDLKPGQITDLRSLSVNNISFAHVALSQSLHKYLIKDSNSLTEAIKKFEIFVNSSNSESDMLEEAPCPKVLGDIVESSVGAILLDTGFDLRRVWSLMLKLLQPVLIFSSVQLNPVRELRELCQYFKLGLNLPDPVKEANSYLVKVEVNVKGEVLSFNSVNKNSKAGRKIAAREALSYLKRRGYKHIAKSLGEVMRKTRRQEAELIGFNEEPLVVYNVDDHFEKLNLQKVPSTLDSQNANNGRVSSEGTCYSSRTGGGKESLANESYERSISEPVIHNHEQKNVNVASCPQDIILHKMEKSLLMEMCEANCWDRPSFECYKVEGPPHLRMFTYKVTVKVEGAQSTILECFGEARPKKRAAEDHAAEGALWYLKHLGYRN